MAEGAGTRLDLIHMHWERLGDQARVAGRGYPIGWAHVLSVYACRRGPLVAGLNMVCTVLRWMAYLRGNR